MIKKLFFLIGICCLLVLSCGETPVSATSNDQGVTSGEDPGESESEYPVVELSVPLFQIREAPNVESKGLVNLHKGDPLELLGPVSEHTTRLTMGRQTFYQPWLLVRTADGAEGWVHAAVIEGDIPDELRLKALIGKELAQEAILYCQAFNEMKAAASVVNTISRAHQLCEQLTLALQLQPSEVASEVAQLLPALTISWVPFVRSWQFYVDYKAFGNAAKRTDGSADDVLLDLYYAAYPVDSIGYLYPGWKLEVDEEAVFSLLGKGVHISYLGQLDQSYVHRDVAGPAIDRLKALIINDMTKPTVLYWESKEKVQAELKSILDTTFAVLTPADTLALHQSLMVLQDTANAKERRFNFRAGH